MSSLALFFKTNLIAADSEIQWITPSNVVSSREIWSVVVSQMWPFQVFRDFSLLYSWMHCIRTDVLEILMLLGFHTKSAYDFSKVINSISYSRFRFFWIFCQKLGIWMHWRSSLVGNFASGLLEMWHAPFPPSPPPPSLTFQLIPFTSLHSVLKDVYSVLRWFHQKKERAKKAIHL